MQGMTKFIIMIIIAAVIIPVMWEFLFPWIISQGYNPTPNG
jgi:hypothetical protein